MALAQIHLLPAARNTVMVVDDQSTGRAILEQVVRTLDDRVVVEGFARPVDAVVWATRHVADLVLVDYMMPDMDGIELVGRLRALPGYEHVPIVMITGQDDKKIRYAALDAGITDFLTKPVDARECLARCRNLLTLRRQQLALEDKRRLLEGMVDEATREIREREKETLLRLARAEEFRDEETGHHLTRMALCSREVRDSSIPAAAESPRPSHAERQDADPVMNSETLANLEELGSSPAFMNKLIGVFVTDNATLMTKMEAGLAARNIGEFRSHLHAMKGSAASMGAERLTGYCRDVGRLTDAEIKLQGPPLLKSLREELATTRDALDRYLQGRKKSAG
jgi:DNA-binding response OmpR family regulator/HPt (histidine-containing phosphotransfer) domain-containing protein